MEARRPIEFRSIGVDLENSMRGSDRVAVARVPSFKGFVSRLNRNESLDTGRRRYFAFLLSDSGLPSTRGSQDLIPLANFTRKHDEHFRLSVARPQSIALPRTWKEARYGTRRGKARHETSVQWKEDENIIQKQREIVNEFRKR